MKIYHVKNPTFRPNLSEFNRRGFDLVAELPTNDLDQAFEQTQNLDEAWRQPISCRSSSVGDVFVRDSGKAFVVASCGFAEIEVQP